MGVGAGTDRVTSRGHMDTRNFPLFAEEWIMVCVTLLHTYIQGCTYTAIHLISIGLTQISPYYSGRVKIELALLLYKQSDVEHFHMVISSDQNYVTVTS